MSSTIQKILQLCERQCFIQPVKDSLDLVEYFKFGFAGELLKNNVHQEWMLGVVINADENVFPFHSCKSASRDIIKDFSEPFEYVKKLNNAQLPFGITETRQDVRDTIDSSLQEEMRYFYPKKHTTLLSCIFAKPGNAMQRFYQWQRQRKMWWRKLNSIVRIRSEHVIPYIKIILLLLLQFSASPGRFSLTDIQNMPEAQLVEIKAEFPWGSQTVETIRYFGAKPFENSGDEHKTIFEVKDGRKKVLPHIIESVISLDTSVMVFVCDAFDEPLFLDSPRQVTRFHRKLAPYKVSFSASSSSATVGEELSELSLFLTKQLRNAGISTLLLPDVARKSLESQFARNDELGIPYTIVLNDATLRNGIVGMRSRDTTLKEQVHVYELKTYMEKLLKNY
ncbi:hypothetical protein L9F63_020988 [Diploptera punctata]|uniref:Anticodon-binding domain-containing protein n=1 Tax=Diploptera punctata TaxID=6984 RepID=A0AAD7ZRS4_DIPPU|nr:hypothetical protein L9F63_020988 [Diploptera punctata]